MGLRASVLRGWAGGTVLCQDTLPASTFCFLDCFPISVFKVSQTEGGTHLRSLRFANDVTPVTVLF